MRSKRNIVLIDEEKCNGCGQCIDACAEGAIALVDGKARLVSEVYCDGLGACLGECPVDAITIEEREADEFDEAATEDHLKRRAAKAAAPAGCPGTAVRDMREPPGKLASGGGESGPTALANWPIQLALLPTSAPYLQGAHLLVAADCTSFALADFHGRFLEGRVLTIGCPKLDDGQAYIDKLAEIIRTAGLASITVLHMEVPCCNGLLRIAEAALEAAKSDLELRDVMVGIGGQVLSDTGAA